MTVEEASSQLPGFNELSLSAPVLRALEDVGYETPSPIQAEIIPHMLAGRDVLGQAQTGTGKTAAFALPLLSNVDVTQQLPQVMVLAPTRELAIQVAEAFQKYASHIKGFHVLPVYGGQDYRGQIRQLKRGVQVVVGTPGRVMDHMRKGTLNLEALRCLVLDEGDEMLRMGFIDDVEWVLDQIPESSQIALFSATMPKEIRKIARRYLQEPEEVTIKVRTATAETINQRYWTVSGAHKLDALTRILEAEEFDGMIVFVRTKMATVELAEKLEARGYASAALNGDIVQKQREMTVERLKKGKLDILVATDVAARGLDVERISHVINYDIPYDTEAYIHRIGRTGRAGRTGEAILFVAPREKRLLYSIEKATKKKIEMMELPSTELINDKRIARFKQQITDTLAKEGLEFFHGLVEQYQMEHNIPALDVAAALAKLLQGDQPLLLSKPKKVRTKAFEGREGRDERKRDKPGKRRRNRDMPDMEEGMHSYRIDVGHSHGVKPGNIVGAIANEAGLDSAHIGRIQIFDYYSTVDLPEAMPKDVFMDLKNVRVSGQKMNITRFSGESSESPYRGKASAKKRRTHSRETENPSDKGKPKKNTRPKD